MQYEKDEAHCEPKKKGSKSMQCNKSIFLLFFFFAAKGAQGAKYNHNEKRNLLSFSSNPCLCEITPQIFDTSQCHHALTFRSTPTDASAPQM